MWVTAPLGTMPIRWQSRGWWEKYGPMILPVVTIAMLAFGFLIMAYSYDKYIVPAQQRLGGSVNALAEKFDDLGKAYDKLVTGTRQVTVAPP